MSKAIDILLLEVQCCGQSIVDKPATNNLLGYDEYAVSIARRIVWAMGVGTLRPWNS
jgi:hypothetical protein